MTTFEELEPLRADVKSTLDERDEVADYRLLNMGSKLDGIIDVYANDVPNLNAYAETLADCHAAVEVTDLGKPTAQRKLGGPFLGTGSSETYDQTVYRYEITVTAEP